MGQFNSDSIPGKMPFPSSCNFALVLVLNQSGKVIKMGNLNHQEEPNANLKVPKECILGWK